MPPDQEIRHETLPSHIQRLLSGEVEADGQAVIDLHNHIKKVHRRLNGSTDPPLANLTQTCLTLAEMLLRGRTESPPILEAIRLNLEFVAGVIDKAPTEASLQEHFGRILHAARQGATRYSPDGHQTLGLKMVNHRRLGEILVSLCMLCDEDLSLALRMQKVTGKKIGDTLLEMGLVSKEQLDNALRMQNLRAN